METTAKFQTLYSALDVINRKYAGNVRFDKAPPLVDARWVRFTLKVGDSHRPGALVRDGKHLAHACWHVHGDFFDAVWNIEPLARIKTAVADMKDRTDNWQDSTALPDGTMLSELCDCGDHIMHIGVECPKCGSPRHWIANATAPAVNACGTCSYLWNPDNETWKPSKK